MCKHCQSKVLNALQTIDGVNDVQVSLQKKTATFYMDKKVTDNLIDEVIENAGFKVVRNK